MIFSRMWFRNILSSHLILFTFLSLGVFAQVDTFQFDKTENQERFRNLSNELRCPMCQNTSLSGSSGGVAEDLRREIYLMIKDGQTDQEIKDFMFERYGDFIFYKPRLTTGTIFLWAGPAFFLLIGGCVGFSVFRSAQSVTLKNKTLTDSEQNKIESLLTREEQNLKVKSKTG